MGIGIIIIGDEILSGKREDKHLSKFIQILAARGLQLDWAEYVGDQRDRIISTLHSLERNQNATIRPLAKPVTTARRRITSKATATNVREKTAPW